MGSSSTGERLRPLEHTRSAATRGRAPPVQRSLVPAARGGGSESLLCRKWAQYIRSRAVFLVMVSSNGRRETEAKDLAKPAKIKKKQISGQTENARAYGLARCNCHY